MKPHPKELRIEDYTYELPDERIAKHPLAVRDASKLLVYDGNITEDTYRNIASHIPAGALMVFNQTKVVHARLLFTKPTGGVIEVFCLAPEDKHTDMQTAMLQKEMVQWECLVGGASKWKHGMVLQLVNDSPGFTLSARITGRTAGAYILALEWDNEALTFAEVLHYAGKVPLPPYLHRSADVKDEERYQTLFAKDEGSVAAPTAGLHFTNEVLDSLAAKNIDRSFVTLHVGAGTFMPVKSSTMAEHEMHTEWIEITRETIQQLKAHPGGKIVAVGTTSLRTLESLYWIGNKLVNGIVPDMQAIAVTQWDAYETAPTCNPQAALDAIINYLDTHKLSKLLTRTQILIAEGYEFKIANGLVTNFHQPQSTLLLLVSAFIGTDWRRVYEYAMAHEYRFLSYGDGCLLWAGK